MNVARRLDRLERSLHAGLPLDAEQMMDAEIEALAAELEARDGAGAFAALLARIRTEFAAAPARRRGHR